MRFNRRRRLRGGRVALVVLAGALALAGCDDSEQEPATVSVVVPAPEEPPAGEPPAAGEPAEQLDAEDVEAAPSAEPPAPETTLALDTPAGAYPVIWVRAGQEVKMRTEPGGGELVERIGRQTEFQSPSVFGVIEERGDWAGVSTPLLPNGQLGWIRLDPDALEGGWTRYSIVVDLSERTAQLLLADRLKQSFAVSVGAPASETPAGRFAITDTFTGLNSAAYGCCALALSANQPNPPSGWLGGRRIAIHGTSGPLGEAISHGCVRAADAEVSKLVKTVPLGTPVFVRA